MLTTNPWFTHHGSPTKNSPPHRKPLVHPPTPLVHTPNPWFINQNPEFAHQDWPTNKDPPRRTHQRKGSAPPQRLARESLPQPLPSPPFPSFFSEGPEPAAGRGPHFGQRGEAQHPNGSASPTQPRPARTHHEGFRSCPHDGGRVGGGGGGMMQTASGFLLGLGWIHRIG